MLFYPEISHPKNVAMALAFTKIQGPVWEKEFEQTQFIDNSEPITQVCVID